MERQYGTPEPVDVEVDREHGVTLVWSDGHTSRYRLADLRAGCPCAQCRNARMAGGPSWPAPPGTAEQLRVEGAEFAGNYGLQLRWNDGHQTGIFTWELLRRWCGCPRGRQSTGRSPASGLRTGAGRTTRLTCRPAAGAVRRPRFAAARRAGR